MFATLNLQLTSTITTLEPSGELTDAGTAPLQGKGDTQSPFSHFLGLRTDIALDPEATGGHGLPESGKPLPPLRPPKLFEGLASSQLAGDGQQSTPGLEIQVPAILPKELKPGLALDSDIDVEIEVAYLPTEISTTEPSQVTLLPIERIPGVEISPTSIKPLEIKAEATNRLGTDALTAARPAQSLAPEINIALATQTRSQTVPTGGETVVLPNTESLVRDRVLQANQQSPVATTVAANNTIDGAEEALLVPITRAAGAVESVQRPDFRVAGLSSAQASTPAHLTPTISPFAAETALGRSEPLLGSIATPVRDAAWGQKLGEQLITLTGNQIKTAEIKLTPADLGPLRVQISIDEGAANVTFQAQHAVTREAIEQALPRLREMMAENGVSLGQTDVSEQGVSEGERERQSDSAATGTGELTDEVVESELLERRKTVASNNLLDTFA